MRTWRGLIDRYRKFLPVGENTPVVTLNEGNTPLIKMGNLGKIINPAIDIYLKFEGLNPTGSFKDRGMTMALSKAVEEGAKSVICASTGNTSASAAAYSARAGIQAYVLIPEGKIAMGKLSQAMIQNAKVLQVKGNFDDAMNLVKEISAAYPVTVVNSVNPFRLEGQKTAAMEICDALGREPDYHVLPVGNAGNITANYMGYKDYKDAGIISGLPRMLGFQASGAAPIVKGYAIKDPETVATAIRIGNPENWEEADKIIRESGGLIDMVSDDEILDAYRLVAKNEGVFCEPASAAAIAGVIKLNKNDFFADGATVVCTLTGHGLKDPDVAIKNSPDTFQVNANLKEVISILGF